MNKEPHSPVRDIDCFSPTPTWAGSSVAEGKSTRVFIRIHDPNINLVIWNRRLPEMLGCWLNELPADFWPNDHLLVSCGELGTAIEALLHSSGAPAGVECSALAKDITAVGRLFADAMDTDAVEVRLEAIGHDACWKFHRDCVAARLVTTYRGPGTEWVHPQEEENALASQRAYAGPVNRLPEHAVALYKGSRAEYQKGVVHRSPAVADTGIVRFFLCINTPSTIHG
jgi:hypothetical protein